MSYKANQALACAIMLAAAEGRDEVPDPMYYRNQNRKRGHVYKDEEPYEDCKKHVLEGKDGRERAAKARRQ
jgi:hypothetical protein